MARQCQEGADGTDGTLPKAITGDCWREDVDMIAQGLLVEGPNGEDFLLTIAPHRGSETHRLVVLQEINGRWERVDGIQGAARREALIGALVDFLVDLCRVLNSSAQEPAVTAGPVRQSKAGRSRTAQPNFPHTGRYR
jgi:hypothetical protein